MKHVLPTRCWIKKFDVFDPSRTALVADSVTQAMDQFPSEGPVMTREGNLIFCQLLSP